MDMFNFAFPKESDALSQTIPISQPGGYNALWRNICAPKDAQQLRRVSVMNH